MNRKVELAAKFDRKANMYERNRKTGALGLWRQQLLKNVTGKVLELGVGAGANFPYYDASRVEVTAVDFSPNMIHKAKHAAVEYGITANFVQADVDHLELPDDSFDFVISTLSLCGYDNPLQVLTNMNRWCHADGEILLLEHGLGHNHALRGLQHLTHPLFKKLEGCHFNRDMAGLVTQSPLELQRVERHFAGMIYIMWAKPRKEIL
ncbi:class I SAM-dependent methyltransferase [Brevibacillus daliensis]|uniref:class I SAM-dependent methyltransferase n=1 Tax=Brevibacillus daliensis TaxID=2892995 RepID=UPI001E55D394|nr:class I SAM-dependent methyltransferase [Brevibacillus daliensis]